MSGTVRVVIKKGGRGVEIETRGFKGAECEQATRFLEEALGQVEATQRTQEFYDGPQVEENA